MRSRYFDKYRTVAVINFFVERWGGKADLFDLIKLIYHADKTYLNKTGHTITRDSYAAMEKGPVASGVYDLLKEARRDITPRHDLRDFACHYLDVTGNDVSMRNPADMDELSEDEIATLEEVFLRFGGKGYLSWQATHDAAWDNARHQERQWMAYDEMVDDPAMKDFIRDSAQDGLPPLGD